MRRYFFSPIDSYTRSTHYFTVAVLSVELKIQTSHSCACRWNDDRSPMFHVSPENHWETRRDRRCGGQSGLNEENQKKNMMIPFKRNGFQAKDPIRVRNISIYFFCIYWSIHVISFKWIMNFSLENIDPLPNHLIPENRYCRSRFKYDNAHILISSKKSTVRIRVCAGRPAGTRVQRRTRTRGAFSRPRDRHTQARAPRRVDSIESIRGPAAAAAAARPAVFIAAGRAHDS